jgi:hypothetical protein
MCSLFHDLCIYFVISSHDSFMIVTHRSGHVLTELRILEVELTVFFKFSFFGLVLYFPASPLGTMRWVIRSRARHESQCCASQATVKEVTDSQVFVNDCQNLNVTLTLLPDTVESERLVCNTSLT